MAPVTTMTDFGLKTDDIKYLELNSSIRGRGPDRLKYLDLEGRWLLSGKSMPYISAAFNQTERLNDARTPFRDITDQPINALGMVRWTPSSRHAEVEREAEKKPVTKFKLPVSVTVDEETPSSPREPLPHRSAGYGPAHHKRKLSIPDRSRSVSPMRAESPALTYDKYAKYERKRTGGADSGYSSPPRSTSDARPPHRTPTLSPRISTPIDHSTIRASPYKEELKVLTRETRKSIPYRSGGYGAYHEKRQYDLSPRSIGSAGDYTSGSEQVSPVSNYDRNADEIVLMAYHSRKTVGTSPRRRRDDWIRH